MSERPIDDGALIAYRPRLRPRGGRPGAHRSREDGGLGHFRAHAPFSRHPEPRHIDLRATLKDVFGELQVRRFEPPGAVDVYALVDLSASLGFQGAGSAFALSRRVATALARAAARYGDAFGIVGAGERPREDFYIRATRRRGVEQDVDALFARHKPDGAGGDGLIEAAARLGGRRKLVFVLSDFLFSLDRAEALMTSLAAHDVTPIVFRDTASEEGLPTFGLIELRDLETGRGRLYFMRPSLRRRWLDEARAHDAALDRLFLRHGAAPVRVVDRLDLEELSRALTER
ncbi:DUF58 domain-containing protein [Methylocella sp.]|uniref:DUF58 domain-containing protein n=1 Tax=Methylocella sp. TaxID=1978226 RepID=UPI003784BBF8